MEYIIKYTGDILSLGYPTELLDAQFAILELLDQPPSRLLEHRQVTFYEPARQLSCLADRSMEAACIPPVQRKSGLGLTGRGVLIGFVDSGLDLNHPEFLGEDGLSRVAALWDMTAEGTPPEGFLRGAVFSGEEIAAGLAPSVDQEGHGTAVAAIAAGRSGVAPRRVHCRREAGQRQNHGCNAGGEVSAGPGGAAGDALRGEPELRHQLRLPPGAVPV